MGENKISSIFIYGTLKRGERNYDYVDINIGRQTRIKIYKAMTNGDLYTLGHLPVAKFDNNTQNIIYGEVHIFDESCFPRVLALLDHLEGYNTPKDSLYIRKIINVTLENGREMQTYAYEFNRFSACDKSELKPVPNGTWTEKIKMRAALI